MKPRATHSNRPDDVARARRVAALRRKRAMSDLRCRERGCTETLALIDISVGTHEDQGGPGPVLHLNIQAPYVYEQSDDPRVKHGQRLRLTGATSPDFEGTHWTFSSWKRGEKIELACRHGHVSQFGAGELARRLRDVLD